MADNTTEPTAATKVVHVDENFKTVDTPPAEQPAPPPLPNLPGALVRSPLDTGGIDLSRMFSTVAAFEAGQRVATMLAKSDMLPVAYKGNVANCFLLLDIASRFTDYGISPIMVAQQLVPVKGKYSWQGQFVVAVINMSKRYYEPLSFEWKRDEKTQKATACRAVTYAKLSNGDRGTMVTGPWVTWEMVVAEGWDSNAKWKNITDLMFMYRSASFFSRVNCPELLMGMGTMEEVEDTMIDVTPKGAPAPEAEAATPSQPVDVTPAKPATTKPMFEN